MIRRFNLFLFIGLFSCEKSCDCELVVYESTFQTNYEWIEISRKLVNDCERDTLSSSYLDQNDNISYVKSIIECSK